MFNAFSSPPPAVPVDGRKAEREIFDRVLGAIAERRLPPGARLTEAMLVQIFGVTRARVRKVLLLLSQRGVITLAPNRGACVTEPSLADTAALFEARHTIESQTIAKVAALTGAVRQRALEALEAHLAEEDAARNYGNHGRIIRLSGEFHRLVAELAGNPVLAGIMEDLVWRTALALATHAAYQDTDCSPSEHRVIVAALRAGDRAEAVRLMTAHLDHIAHLTRCDNLELHDDDLSRAADPSVGLKGARTLS